MTTAIEPAEERQRLGSLARALARWRSVAWLVILIADVGLLAWAAMAALAPERLLGPNSTPILPAGYQGYFVAGALAFITLTHVLYEGANPLFGSYLRTPDETQLWQHVTTWFLPAQVLRGMLIGLALIPFLPVLRRWSVLQRMVAVGGLYLVMGFWAAAVAAPGNIEGLVYLRPAFSPDVALVVQPEIIVQGAAMALLVALGLERL